jgi:hypothetical protein
MGHIRRVADDEIDFLPIQPPITRLKVPLLKNHTLPILRPDAQIPILIQICKLDTLGVDINAQTTQHGNSFLEQNRDRSSTNPNLQKFKSLHF